MSFYDKSANLIFHRCNDADRLNRAIEFNRHHSRIMVECDVRLTADQIHVAYHNRYFNNRRLNAQSFSKLGGAILPLETVLKKAKEHQLILHLDVKVMKQSDKWVAAADSKLLFDQLEQYEMTDKVIISNIKGKFLKTLRAQSSTIKLGTLYDEDYGYLRPDNKTAVQHFINHILGYHQEIGLEAVFFNQYWLSWFDKQFDMLDRVFYVLVKAGINVAVWTVNKEKTARYFLDRGAGWITTDHPENLHHLLINPSPQDAKRYSG